MIDYLCHIADLASEADTVAMWASQVDGQWVFHLPPLSDALMVEAYSDLGDGHEPPTIMPGHWIIVSIGSGNPIPEVVAPYVVAQADRDAGLTLSAGIAGLSTMWAGMTITPTP